MSLLKVDSLTDTAGTGSPSFPNGFPSLPSGAVIMHAGSSAPSGYLLCDGSAVSRTTYASLFAAISTTYGVGDGSTTFNLPNTQGVFVKGVGSQTISSIAHSGTLGTTQNDQMQGHFHGVSDPTHGHNLESNTGGSIANLNNGTQIAGLTGATAAGYVAGPPFVQASSTGLTVTSPSTDGSNGTPRTGTETRPANISMNYIIKT